MSVMSIMNIAQASPLGAFTPTVAQHMGSDIVDSMGRTWYYAMDTQLTEISLIDKIDTLDAFGFTKATVSDVVFMYHEFFGLDDTNFAGYAAAFGFFVNDTINISQVQRAYMSNANPLIFSLTGLRCVSQIFSPTCSIQNYLSIAGVSGTFESSVFFLAGIIESAGYSNGYMFYKEAVQTSEPALISLLLVGLIGGLYLRRS